jgi:hypothetical protein
MNTKNELNLRNNEQDFLDLEKLCYTSELSKKEEIKDKDIEVEKITEAELFKILNLV